MPFAVFNTVNGVPTIRIHPGPEGLHDTYQDAKLWLTRNMEKFGGDPDNYVVETVNEQGFRMEKVNSLDSEAAGVLASELIRTDKQLRMAVGTMILARQLHTSANEEAVGRLAELRESREIPEILDELVYQVAANKAVGEFSNIDLAAQLPTLTEWITELCDRDNKAQKNEDRRELEVAEADRRATPILLPFEPVEGIGKHWKRSQSLCFAGDSQAVSYMLNYLDASIGSIKVDEEDPEVKHPWQQVLRFAEETDENNLPTIQVPKTVWRNCCKSGGDLVKVLAVAGSYMDIPADVVIVDNLKDAKVGISPLGTSLSGANKAHKLLKSQCKKFGAGLIAGIVVDDLKDLTSASGQRLREFTTIRTVSVETHDDGQVSLFLGARRVVGPIPKADLQRKKETIITLD